MNRRKETPKKEKRVSAGMEGGRKAFFDSGNKAKG